MFLNRYIVWDSVYVSELLHPFTPKGSLRSGEQVWIEESTSRARHKHSGDRAFAIFGPRL